MCFEGVRCDSEASNRPAQLGAPATHAGHRVRTRRWRVARAGSRSAPPLAGSVRYIVHSQTCPQTTEPKGLMTYNTAWPHRPVLTGDLSESSRAAPRPAPGTEATIASRFRIA